MRNRTVLVLLLPLLFASALFGQETVVYGDEDAWSRLATRERIVAVPGRGGFQDVQLEAFSHSVDEETELLLHFDALPLSDAAGLYRVAAEQPELATAIARTGRGALLIDGPEDLVHLQPGPQSHFRPGLEWGSFTIEFWLYPVHLADGAVVFSWDASEEASRQFRRQSIRALVDGGQTAFEFENFFVPPDGSPYTVRMVSDRNIIPRRWSHHAVRFDGRTGLLEYVQDGVPESITYVSTTGRQDGSVFYPRIAPVAGDGLRVGDGFVGALDELRIVRRFVEDLSQPSFHGTGGRIITQPLDLGSPGATPLSVTARITEPGLSDVFLYYRVSDFRTASTAESDQSWLPIESGEPISGGTGRFVQIRADLFPDPVTNQSPTLSSLRFSYQPDAPPLPPTFVQATPMDGSIRVEWAPVREADVVGYFVYYGTQSGRYFGDASTNGPSPVDVGPVTSTILDGLQNGQIYFIAVSAYDAQGNLFTTDLSREVSARPARVHR